MNYTKPEITSLASASSVIQSGTKPTSMTQDNNDQFLQTVSAYESDE
jgi:hypothetical protein